MDIRRELPAFPDAARTARRALDGWLTALVGEDTADDIRLATSELIDNAVRHAGLRPGDVIVLSGIATEDTVRIAIEQRTSVADVRPVGPADRGPLEGGFGLRIVQELASDWGVLDDQPGSVWFEVDRGVR